MTTDDYVPLSHVALDTGDYLDQLYSLPRGTIVSCFSSDYLVHANGLKSVLGKTFYRWESLDGLLEREPLVSFSSWCMAWPMQISCCGRKKAEIQEGIRNRKHDENVALYAARVTWQAADRDGKLALSNRYNLDLATLNDKPL